MTLQETLRLHASWLEGNAEGRRADLSGADLRRANLAVAKLAGADLRRADLSGADLRRANLAVAKLAGADLRRANLRGADLRNANLSGADLRNADLLGADLRHAKSIYEVDMIDPRGYRPVADEVDMVDPRGYRPVAVAHAAGWRIASGCRWLTTAEALAHWSDPNHKRPDIAARYIRAVNDLPPAEKRL
jgi:hypothetical protein